MWRKDVSSLRDSPTGRCNYLYEGLLLRAGTGRQSISPGFELSTCWAWLTSLVTTLQNPLMHFHIESTNQSLAGEAGKGKHRSPCVVVIFGGFLDLAKVTPLEFVSAYELGIIITKLFGTQSCVVPGVIGVFESDCSSQRHTRT